MSDEQESQASDMALEKHNKELLTTAFNRSGAGGCMLRLRQGTTVLYMSVRLLG